MKRFIFLSFLVFGVLAFGFAKADVVCERTAGSTIYNGDIFDYSCSGLANPAPTNCGLSGEELCAYAQMGIIDGSGWFCPAAVVSLASTYSFSDDLDSYIASGNNVLLLKGDTNAVNGSGCLTGTASGIGGYAGTTLSGFNVVSGYSPTPTPTGILNVPSGFISTFLGFISDMASGIWGLVALLIGLPLAFWVIKKVIVVVRDK
jgi:hypothetical protein